jgi:hypothetical protein
MLLDGYQIDEDEEDFDSEYILETDCGFMERRDTIVA